MALRAAAKLAVVAGVGGFAYYKTLAGPGMQFEALSAMGPAFRMLDAETSHNLGIKAAQWGLFPIDTRPEPASLRTRVWGLDFPNPVGAASGTQVGRRGGGELCAWGWQTAGGFILQARAGLPKSSGNRTGRAWREGGRVGLCACGWPAAGGCMRPCMGMRYAWRRFGGLFTVMDVHEHRCDAHACPCHLHAWPSNSHATGMHGRAMSMRAMQLDMCFRFTNGVLPCMHALA
uniref:Uncharacterized protein n=1 Tax=Chlamydomonas euryale TaxID=1486919 RepID=A0A7R9YQL9_9CHLO|mmetsp:Transcript_13913/g.40335  ORF Transcript_13913/g.40335 Transcript_13913/m.40335 type:complete len:232 (+) Transcript_13913:125-820(+)